MLYIEADKHTRRVLLASVDSKYAPNCEEYPTYLAYSEPIDNNFKENKFSRDSGIKDIIYRVLLTQLNEPYSVLSLR